MRPSRAHLLWLFWHYLYCHTLCSETSLLTLRLETTSLWIESKFIREGFKHFLNCKKTFSTNNETSDLNYFLKNTPEKLKVWKRYFVLVTACKYYLQYLHSITVTNSKYYLQRNFQEIFLFFVKQLSFKYTLQFLLRFETASWVDIQVIRQNIEYERNAKMGDRWSHEQHTQHRRFHLYYRFSEFYFKFRFLSLFLNFSNNWLS